MKSKILVSIFALSVSNYTYGTDNSAQHQNETVKIYKYSGAAADRATKAFYL